MELHQAKVVEVLNFRTGESQHGHWECIEIIVRDTLPVPHPEEVLIRYFNVAVPTVQELRPGDTVHVQWESTVRRYTNREGVQQATAENRGFYIEKL